MKMFRRILNWGVLGILLMLCAQAQSSEPARLTVQSDPPGAIVVLDGKELEIKTPVRVNVAPGIHQIRLVKVGYRQASREVEVYSGTGFASFKLVPVKNPVDASGPGHAAKPAVASAEQQGTAAPAPAKGAVKTQAHEKNPGDEQAARKSRASGQAGNTPSAAEPAAKQKPKKNNSPEDQAKEHAKFSGTASVEYREHKPAAEDKESWTLLPKDNPFSKWLSEREKEKEQKADRADNDYVDQEEDEDDDEEEDVFPLLMKESERKENTADEEMTDLEADQEEDEPEALAKPEAEEDEATAGDSVSPEPGPEKASQKTPETTPVDGGSVAPESDPKEPRVAWPDSAETHMYQAAVNLPQFPEKFNILLLGLDRRDARGMLATGKPYTVEELKRKSANSDVIMVAQLDFVDRQVRLVSIPRDTKVKIPGRRGSRKINAAYAYGREKMSARVVGDLLGIPIHRTVTVDWRGAKKCISLFKSLGLDYNGFTEKELFWHLRKRSFAWGDFHRIERQQTFLRYSAGEYLRIYNETRKSQGTVGVVKQGILDMAIKQGLNVVETNLSCEEAQLLSYAFRDYDVRKITLAQVTGRGRLEGADEDSGGVYFFTPSPRHSFDEIIARAEADSGAGNP